MKVHFFFAQMSTIKLKSAEGKIFSVDRESVKCMEMIENMIATWGDEMPNEPIHLKQVNSESLEKVLKWCAENKNTQPRYDASSHFNTFDAKFIEDNDDILFELIDVANYLGVKNMLSVLCRSVALKLKNKTVLEIREEFGITED